MRKALIQGLRVAQIVPADAAFPVASPLVWVDLTDEHVTTDYSYVDERFVPPAETSGPLRLIGLNAFLDRLRLADGSVDEEKQLAVFQARRNDARIDRWLTRAAVEPFDPDGPETTAALNHLVAVGLITADDRRILLDDGDVA